jgi:S1-C subfamily serine protease
MSRFVMARWHGGNQPTDSAPAAGFDRRRAGWPRSRRLWAFAGVITMVGAAVGVSAAVTYGSGVRSDRFATFTRFSSPGPDPCVKCPQSLDRRPTNPLRPPSLNSAVIAAATDSSIVDITSTLAGQGGEAAGTGMVLTASGEILTNNHVIANATSVVVKVSNGSQTFPAKVVGTDAVHDVAVLQAQGASGLPVIPLDNSSQVSVGDSVVAIGNALNRPGPPTVTEGTITGVARSITVQNDVGVAEQLSNLFETTAQLEPGNSGGPLFDTPGRVIGMNTAATTGSNPNFGSNDGFAIPINDAIGIVHQIEHAPGTGTVNPGAPGFLGVNVQFNGSAGDGGHSPAGRASSGDQGRAGALVVGVQAGSPAENAGLVPGDEIVSVDGQTVTSSTTFTQVIGAKHAGDTVQISWVDQQGNHHSAAIQLASPPA